MRRSERPPDGKTNWALGAYGQYQDEWKQQVKDICGRKVDLVVMEFGSEEYKRVLERGTAHRLWP
jgi:hypothetical protein